jgi:isoleucyl-tRNA synthetase
MIEILSRLLAPFVPHLAEAIYHHAGGGTADSVHGTGWPEAEPEWADPEILAQVVILRRLAALVQAARNQARIAQDQLLPQALVHGVSPDATAEKPGLDPALAAEVLRVGQVRFTAEANTHVTWHLTLSPERAAKQDTLTPEVETAFGALDPSLAARLASQLWEGLSVSLEVADRAVTLLPDDVTVSATAQPGWTAATDSGLLVVLDVG